MRVLCIAQVEDRTNLVKQIYAQTVMPDRLYLHWDSEPAQGINARRLRIAENHQKLREVVKEYQPDLVWQVEGDCDLPRDALERLLQRYEELKGDDFGYVSGIQVGRHGIYCLGAWRNVTDESFESLDHKLTGLQQVDATGFYCLLAPRDVWLSGKCEWNGEPWGPDVNWGLSITGKKYVDMGVPIGHITNSGIIKTTHISTCNVKFYKDNGRWKYKTS